MTDVLIFVPGLMGSELWDEQGRVWPGNLSDAVLGFSEAKFKRLCAPNLEPRDIARSAVGVVDLYGGWVETFSALVDRDSGQALFKEGGAKPTLIAAPYDWRDSIAVGAKAVASAVQRAVHMHGAGVEIYIAAHSMGGLVSRYFLQSEEFQRTLGFDRIAALLTFGTPHKGAVIAFAGAIGQDKAHFLNTAQSIALANDPRYPGVYNLFPQPGSRPIWEQGGANRLKAHDVFDREWAKQFNLTESNLADAEAVFKILERPWPKIRTFLFVGSRFETMTHMLWDGRRANHVKTRDGGDGTVNLQGAMLENQQLRLTDKNHMSLVKATEVRIALQDIFNADGILAIAAETEISLAVAELFVENRQPVEIALSVTGPGAEVDGTLYLERARTLADADEITEDDFSGAIKEYSRELDYVGPELTSLHVKIDDVSGPAVFRPVFETREPQVRRFVGPAFVMKRPED